MSKLCLIYNTAPRYREAIFRAIDQTYDCDWYFGETKTDIKEMDISILKHASYYKYYGNPSKMYWKCTLSKLFSRKYQTYFMLAESRALSDYLFFGLKSLFFPKKKIFIWTHGWYGKESGLEAKLKKWQFNHVEGIFVYSNYGRNLMIEQGIPQDKIFTIHNSLHYDEQKKLREQMKPGSIYVDYFKNNHPTIIFIGRLTAVKKLDMLLQAVANLKKEGECYNVVFVGDGSERKSLEAYASELGIQQQVWFYGACYDEKLNAELVFNADLCVAPGNVGLTAMHTMVFGTPVISHNDFKWQMPEFEAIKAGRTGDFFERDNVDSLKGAICKWFADKKGKREEVRLDCYKEIDTNWNPYYQMDVIQRNLVVK